MAVEASKVKARLRALFPKANLATKRLDEISDKLGKKIEDNATDAQIDEALTEQNELYSFEDIAKNDDRKRTEDAKSKETNVVDAEKTESKTNDEEMPAWAKALVDTVNGFKAEKQAQSLEQRFKSDERLKNINPLLFTGRIPSNEDDFDTAIEALVKDATELKLNNYGGDTPASGTQTPVTQDKKISAEEAKEIVKSMGINV